jgi:hypothetical protein
MAMKLLTLNVMNLVTVVNKKLLSLLIIVAFMGATVSATLFALDFPEPPKSTIINISKNTSAFGITMEIRRFESRLDKDDIIDFYSNLWKDTAAITLFDPWEMIGKAERSQFLNVQVQNGFAGSWGYLSISDLPTAIEKDRLKVPDGAGFPKMSGSQVLSEQKHNDPNKTARTLLINNNFSINSNGNFYRKHYQSQGWQLVADTKGSRLKGIAMTFSKGREVVSLTINQVNSITSVVANIERAKIF